MPRKSRAACGGNAAASKRPKHLGSEMEPIEIESEVQKSTASSASVISCAKLEAAKLLQRAWHSNFSRSTTIKLVSAYLASNSIEHVKSISFECLVVFLREKPIIAVTKACLQRIHVLTTFRHGSPAQALSPDNVNVRVFLAAFMIAFRPSHVFESMGALEQQLYEVALPLMVKFERIATRVISNPSGFQGVPSDVTHGFPEMLFEYLKRFKAWKVPDEAKLTCRIKHALIALYQAEGHLPPEEPDDTKLKIEFRTQITRLRSKLEQIAGRSALDEFDAQRGTGAVPTTAGPGGSTGAGAYASLPGRMSNEQLAHELLLDPKFQLDDSGGCSVDNPVFHRIREGFHQAFWDSLADDLKLAIPCYVRVIRVISEIRDGLNDLLGTRDNDTFGVNEIIDIPLIQQQVSENAIAWPDCKTLIGNIVGIVQKTQAPKRDAETLQQWRDTARLMLAADERLEDQPHAMCSALKFLLDRINAMRIDAANTRLRLISPVIKDHGIDYERGKFQDKLNDGSLTLKRTEGWIDSSIRYVTKDGLVSLEGLCRGTPRDFVALHTWGLALLIFNPQIVKADTVPETLIFDAYRLSTWQAEARYIVNACTALVVLKQFLRGDTAIERMTAVDVQKHFTGVFANGDYNFSSLPADLCEKLDSGGLLLDMSDEKNKDRIKILNRISTSVEQPGDALNVLMSSRVCKISVKCMLDGQMQKIDATDAFTSTVKPFSSLIEKLSLKAMGLANMNRTVHQPTYNDIIAASARKIAGTA